MAINEAVWPAHIVLELTVTEGDVLTTTVVIVAPEQAPFNPATENVVVVIGETIILFPLAPLLHVYVVAPVEVSVVV